MKEIGFRACIDTWVPGWLTCMGDEYIPELSRSALETISFVRKEELHTGVVYMAVLRDRKRNLPMFMIGRSR